jgi:hypothetical protein
MKLVLKLALVALIANAAWRVGSSYVAFYKFKDAVEQEAQFGGEKSPDEIRDRVLGLAHEYDLPIDADRLTVSKADQRTRIAGSYTKRIEVLPGYAYPWDFNWDVETINFSKIQPLRPK